MKKIRLQKIMDHVNRHGSMTVEQAAALLSASLPTVRRDFNSLAENGDVRRFYGGIARNLEAGDPALPFSLREGWFVERKDRLVRGALAFIPAEGVLFIDGGTTTVHLSGYLKSRKLRIITNSLALCRAFEERFPDGEGPELLLTGGIVNRKSALLLGPEAVRTVERFHADAAVMSGTALDAGFIYDNRDDAAEIQRAMIANSEKLVMITDSSKIGRRAMCRVEPVEKISHLVTDFEPEHHELLTGLRRRGVDVVILPASEPGE